MTEAGVGAGFTRVRRSQSEIVSRVRLFPIHLPLLYPTPGASEYSRILL